MTFLESLQSHKGGLIKLKSELGWYGGRSWDNSPGRVCLLLDVASVAQFRERPISVPASAETARAPRSANARSAATAAAYLLVDGLPHWVWLYEQDVEIL